MSHNSIYSCPSCGAPIKNLESESDFMCGYCGSSFGVNRDENGLKFEHRIVPAPDKYLQDSSSIIKPELRGNDFQSSSKTPDIESPKNKNVSSSNEGVASNLKNRGLKKQTKTIIIGVLGFLLICCGLTALIGSLNPESDTTRPDASQNKSLALVEETATITSTIRPTSTSTVTPTPFILPLPYHFKSGEGWDYTITKIQVLKSIGSSNPLNDYFLIILIDIQNQTGSGDCLKMNEFFAINETDKIKMQNSDLDNAKSVYSRDYPGAFLGQCLSHNEMDKSILVFDIPNRDLEWSVAVQDQKVRIGEVDTIINPPPTATPLPSATATITSTPTVTQTSLPSGVVSAPLGNLINVRSGPGVNYAVAFQLEGQSSFTIKGRNEKGDWFFIQTKSGDRGWIRNDLIQSTVESALLPVSIEVVPTQTPSPTFTPTPRPTVPYSQQAPQGTWCAQNDVRGVCVGNLEYRSYVGYTSASSKGRFIVLGIGIKNIGLFDIDVNPFDFTMVMEDGSTYEHASETYYFNNSLQAVTVAPGNTASGALVFYVPKDVGPRKIICRAGIFESNIEIDLYDRPTD